VGRAARLHGSHEDVVAAAEEWLSTDLSDELVNVEMSLVNGVTRRIGQCPPLPFLCFSTGRPARVENHKFVADAASFGEKGHSFPFLQVAVEVAGEDAPDCLVGDREGGCVAAYNGNSGDLDA
jgi:hypothetical protein